MKLRVELSKWQQRHSPESLLFWIIMDLIVSSFYGDISSEESRFISQIVARNLTFIANETKNTCKARY